MLLHFSHPCWRLDKYIYESFNAVLIVALHFSIVTYYYICINVTQISGRVFANAITSFDITIHYPLKMDLSILIRSNCMISWKTYYLCTSLKQSHGTGSALTQKNVTLYMSVCVLVCPYQLSTSCRRMKCDDWGLFICHAVWPQKYLPLCPPPSFPLFCSVRQTPHPVSLFSSLWFLSSFFGPAARVWVLSCSTDKHPL